MSATATHYAQPKRQIDTTEVASGLPLGRQKPTPKFRYVAYPKGWDFEAGQWLPQLRRVFIVPGVNGVDDSGNPERALAHARRKGGVVIDPLDPRLGDVYTNYCSYYDTRDGRRHHVDFCSEATVLSTGEVMWNADECQPAWREFRAYLVTSGIVPPLLAEVYGLILQRERNMLESLTSRCAANPSLRANLEKQAARIAAMVAAWESTPREVTPAPPAKQPKRRTEGA